MNISCNIQLGDGDSLKATPDKAAAAVLKALGGDPEKDHCIVSVMAMPEAGTAGTMPVATQTPATNEG